MNTGGLDALVGQLLRRVMRSGVWQEMLPRERAVLAGLAGLAVDADANLNLKIIVGPERIIQMSGVGKSSAYQAINSLVMRGLLRSIPGRGCKASSYLVMMPPEDSRPLSRDERRRLGEMSCAESDGVDSGSVSALMDTSARHSAPVDTSALVSTPPDTTLSDKDRARALRQCCNAVEEIKDSNAAMLPESERKLCEEIIRRQRRPAKDKHGRPQLDRFDNGAVWWMLDHPHCSLARLQTISQRADYLEGRKGFTKDRLSYFRGMLEKVNVTPLEQPELFVAKNLPEHEQESVAAEVSSRIANRNQELHQAWAFNKSLPDDRRRDLVNAILDGLSPEAQARHRGKYFLPPQQMDDETVLDLWYASLRSGE